MLLKLYSVNSANTHLFEQKWVLAHLNRKNQHFGFWKMEYICKLNFNSRKMEVAMKWFHHQNKVAFFHLSV